MVTESKDESLKENETKIKFVFAAVGTSKGVLDASLNPGTVEAILKALPITGTVNTWGKEIYFTTPVIAEREESSVEVALGDIAYWPPGKAICLFFGPTPASKNEEPTAASPVNVVGRIFDLDVLKAVKDSCKVEVVKGQ